jgi:hypothetical protein
VHGTRRGILVAALVSGLAAVCVAPVTANAATSPAISISVSSGLKLFGDVVVQWANPGLDTVTVSGRLSPAAAGEVLRLFAQPFPFRKPPQAVPGQSRVLRSRKAVVSYVFHGAPHIATRYSVRVYASRTATKALASSGTQSVYEVSNETYQGWRSCNTRGNRPICHQTLRLFTEVPASAYKPESIKHLYVYLGITLGPRLPLPAPKTLSLISATVSKALRLSGTKFEQIVRFSFRVNNDAYSPLFTYCTKGTQAEDGLGLPGHHGCGSHKVSSSAVYLG